jgi:mRNA interferase HigB
MRILALSTLREYWEKNPQAKEPLQGWYVDVSRAQWNTPADIRAQFPKASFVANNRIVFNIHGNDYRLVVAVAYRFGMLFIKFVGTHQEYDKVNVATVEHKT